MTSRCLAAEAVLGALLVSAPRVNAMHRGSPHFASPAPQAICASAQHRAFDFWLGDWDVFDFAHPAAPIAHVVIDTILGGCVIREDYRDNGGLEGRSYSVYDTSRGRWHQSWVTNRNGLLLLDGGARDMSIVLEGADRDADGAPRLVTGTWTPVAGGVRETAIRSTDGGRTWTPWFDLLFRARAPSSAAGGADDSSAVADLDVQYQAAVKANDADTMNRLLPDDFVLVTGRGKSYSRTDLLNDARARTVTWEHQEDSSRVVHVWGNTAVVTALLWEKGMQAGRALDYHVWFSDTYVKTASGWRYVFGQSSLPLP
jgi:ketosteroid isomerase-like protein